MSVRGKSVIITGGARGVGRYVARTFAAEGARVAVADLGPFENVEHELDQAGAGEWMTVKTDVTNELQVRSLMDQVHKRFGRIDVLINDAGIVTHFHEGAPRWSRIRDMDLAFFQKVIMTNLGGTFLCTKHALPYMESLNAGHVINFGQGSLNGSSGRNSNVGACVYGTSKISIRAFTQGVADEEREFNICIVSMGPGTGSGPRLAAGPGVPGGGGGIVTDDSPEWSRQRTDGRGVDSVGNRYILAAEAPMEFSGRQVMVRDGQLAIADE